MGQNMKLIDEHAPWLSRITISNTGIAMGQNERFGIGTLLVAEFRNTRKLLFAKKSFRAGFEGNNQYTFPGGMVRPPKKGSGIKSWIYNTLFTRVAEEVGLDLRVASKVKPLEVTPPVVAKYFAKGKTRHTIIIPFISTVTLNTPLYSKDSTVYDPGWHIPVDIWADITPTNRLIASYYIWNRLSSDEQLKARPFLNDALEQAVEWATEVDLPSPQAPWLFL